MKQKLWFIFVYGVLAAPAFIFGFLYEVCVLGAFAGRQAALDVFPKDKNGKS